jgi:sugar O-acyltransferase (sialic acid O-acetyltransferase NeuD family)
VQPWTIFGCGNLLSDIFDLIHTNGGIVRRVVNNITLNETERQDLDRRIALIAEEVAVETLAEFTPDPGERYCCGFLTGRDGVVPQLNARFGITMSTLTHPTAHVGPNVHLGEGAMIGARSVLAPNCHIGALAYVNRGATVGHDTRVGDFSVLAPGVNVGGLVKIGRNCTVGIGATVIDRIVVGDRAFVGAGSVVVRDVPEGVVVAGVPARFLRQA